MANEFTAVFEREGEWYVAYCPEIPGAIEAVPRHTTRCLCPPVKGPLPVLDG